MSKEKATYADFVDLLDSLIDDYDLNEQIKEAIAKSGQTPDFYGLKDKLDND